MYVEGGARTHTTTRTRESASGKGRGVAGKHHVIIHASNRQTKFFGAQHSAYLQTVVTVEVDKVGTREADDLSTQPLVKLCNLKRKGNGSGGGQVIGYWLLGGADVRCGAVRGRLCGRECSRIHSVMQEEREAQEGWEQWWPAQPGLGMVVQPLSILVPCFPRTPEENEVMHCTVLHCIVLHCTCYVLYCIVLYCN